MSSEEPQAVAPSTDLEKACKDLMDKDRDLATAMEVIVAAYRIHMLALMAVRRIVGNENLPDEVADTMIKAATQRAKNIQFSRPEVTDSILNVVAPFLESETNAERESERTKRLETDMVERVAVKRPPIKVRVNNADVSLERGHVLLAVGDRVKLVKLVAELMFDFVRNNEILVADPQAPDRFPLNIVNLSASQDPPQIKQDFARIMRIPQHKWAYSANVRPAMKVLLTNIANQLEGKAVDIVIVDDGNELCYKSAARFPAHELEEGVRALRRIAAELGAIVICMAPIPDGDADYAATVQGLMAKHTEYIEV